MKTVREFVEQGSGFFWREQNVDGFRTFCTCTGVQGSDLSEELGFEDVGFLLEDQDSVNEHFDNFLELGFELLWGVDSDGCVCVSGVLNEENEEFFSDWETFES